MMVFILLILSPKAVHATTKWSGRAGRSSDVQVPRATSLAKSRSVTVVLDTFLLAWNCCR